METPLLASYGAVKVVRNPLLLPSNRVIGNKRNNVVTTDDSPREEICASVRTRGTLCRIYK